VRIVISPSGGANVGTPLLYDSRKGSFLLAFPHIGIENHADIPDQQSPRREYPDCRFIMLQQAIVLHASQHRDFGAEIIAEADIEFVFNG